MDHDETIDEKQKPFCSGIYQSRTPVAERNTMCSDSLTEEKLKTVSFEGRSDHINIGSQEPPQASMEPIKYEFKFLEHRGNEEFFASDEESTESKRSASSNESSRETKARNSENLMNTCSFREHLNSIPGFYDCDEKVSKLLGLNELLRYRNNDIFVEGTYEDITRQLNHVILNAESNKSSNSSEKESEKLKISPERANVSDYDSSQEKKHSASVIQKSSFSRLQASDHHSQILGSSTKIEVISHFPNHINHFVNTESSEWKSSATYDLGVYSMISTPISSSYIDLESTESFNNSPTTSSFLEPELEMPFVNSSVLSLNRLSKRRLSPTNEAANSTNSKNLRMKLSRSLEVPSSSNHYTHSTKEWQQSNVSSSSAISIRKNTISLSDLLNSSNKTKQQDFQNSFQSHYIRRTHKSSRLLNFDSDTSSDDTKRCIPKRKENQKRRKTSPNHLSNAYENHSAVSKKDNDENVSENAHSSASSSHKYHEKSMEIKGNESTNYVLRSLEIINSENFELNSSTRKRVVSNSKSSDTEKSCEESTANKKVKRLSSEE